MELRPGYKHSDIGIMPEDWEVCSLGGKAKFRTGPFGSALHKSDYCQNGVPVINPMHLVEGQIFPTTSMSVSEAAAKDLAEFRLKANEIVIGRRGDMGRCAVVQEFQSGWLCGTGSMIIRPIDCHPQFLQRVLSSKPVIEAIENSSVGTTMVNLNQGTLASLALQFPPLHEQRAIAAALSDVDAALAGFEQLIAKKRDLKQAAMQQLLTGRTRLPGFSGVWEVKRLGELLRIRHGKGQREVEVIDGPYPILATGGQIGTASRPLYDKPSVLIGRKGTIDEPRFMDTPFWSVDTLFYSEMIDHSDAKFLFYRFTMIDWRRYNEASGVPSLNARTIENIEILAPEPDEQIAIAAVLSEMDSELATLMAQAEKTRLLKQAMMQELLTGRIRLPIAENADG